MHYTPVAIALHLRHTVYRTAGQNPKEGKRMDKKLMAIALEQMGIETLETQNSDSADFHEVSVWSLKAALEAAYKAGQQAGRQ